MSLEPKKLNLSFLATKEGIEGAKNLIKGLEETNERLKEDSDGLGLQMEYIRSSAIMQLDQLIRRFRFRLLNGLDQIGLTGKQIDSFIKSRDNLNLYGGTFDIGFDLPKGEQKFFKNLVACTYQIVTEISLKPVKQEIKIRNLPDLLIKTGTKFEGKPLYVRVQFKGFGYASSSFSKSEFLNMAKNVMIAKSLLEEGPEPHTAIAEALAQSHASYKKLFMEQFDIQYKIHDAIGDLEIYRQSLPLLKDIMNLGLGSKKLDGLSPRTFKNLVEKTPTPDKFIKDEGCFNKSEIFFYGLIDLTEKMS